MNSKYGATSMSTITLRGSTQPQGEPMGVELMGAGQTVLEQPAEGTKKIFNTKGYRKTHNLIFRIQISPCLNNTSTKKNSPQRGEQNLGSGEVTRRCNAGKD
jgi:hypothetical protein